MDTGMTRAEKIARARELRSEGLSQREIAERFGVTRACVTKWLNPEKAREWNRREEAKPERAAAKRAWENANDRPDCPRCGGPRGVGAHRKGMVLCRACRAREADKKRDQILDGYRQGLSVREIAERTGIPASTVKTEAYRMRLSGIEVPYAPTGGAAHRNAA